ncbi:MAG: hypothetical protein UT37_C0004G0026 [Parcubacteria group bacterium GW2011_GWA2_39_18]|nr:MAG: hypothetical protein UT37_C0004G0026 [Parcubacteria group bacterium GW2011_GWA2_39_18]
MQYWSDRPRDLQKFLKGLRVNNLTFSHFFSLNVPVGPVEKPSWAIELLEDSETRFSGQSVSLYVVKFADLGKIGTNGDVIIPCLKRRLGLAGGRAYNALYQSQGFILGSRMLLFLGTQWRDANGDRLVQCLYKNVDAWHGGGVRVDDVNSDCLVVCVGKFVRW